MKQNFKRGRPKGTKKLPRDYQLLLYEAVKERLREGESLSSVCRDICDNGGIKFADDNGNVVAEITKWRTLHSRLTEAMWPLGQSKWLKVWREADARTHRPAQSDEAFRVAFSKGAGGTAWICVPARNNRRVNVVELSQAHQIKLHK